MSDKAVVPSRAEETRSRMIEAAERLLSSSPDHDVSTRAVCDAVGVTQPILYRLFGDKDGLLNALVDDGFERYIARKHALEATDDPVADLAAGWDDHMDFARRNAALYRLMFSPALRAVPAAAGRIFELLTGQLERCAAIGALRISPGKAAQTILSANVGVALSVLSQPERYADPGLSHRVRDAVFAACMTQRAPASPPDRLAVTALQLEAQLAASVNTPLADEERALLVKWLRRFHGES